MKVCPTCKSRCFDDMNTCYGCMHHFSEQDKYKESKRKELLMEDNIPEYFELDTFPFIEDDDYFRARGAHEKVQNPINENVVIKLEIPKSVLEKYLIH